MSTAHAIRQPPVDTYIRFLACPPTLTMSAFPATRTPYLFSSRPLMTTATTMMMMMMIYLGPLSSIHAHTSINPNQQANCSSTSYCTVSPFPTCLSTFFFIFFFFCCQSPSRILHLRVQCSYNLILWGSCLSLSCLVYLSSMCNYMTIWVA
ncbi:hypothetical protein BDN70DRAFT_142084 [Pholiota conissans]|uniref:Uncharacterized protein n=1 Tax=Pholiota conissans TaxID=109636 RepID=A0A9P5ZBD4_9AGAR|nr:hypothetical protein BDN70DRAFT_142084 [Pholiota conissans]